VAIKTTIMIIHVVHEMKKGVKFDEHKKHLR